MSTVFIRSILLYIVVVFSVRLMGKRQLGELQPSELVITILISNIATLPLENPSIPLLMGVLPILVLVCFEVIISWLTLKSKGLRRLISGSPKIVIRDGKIAQKTMRDLRLTVDDLLMALRSNQIFTPEEVQFAIVETTGTISVYPKAAYRTVTQSDMEMHQESDNPPSVVVSDGVVITKALQALGKDERWLNIQLGKQGLSPKQVFLALSDKQTLCTVIARDHYKKGGDGV
ncbi:MAG: DUF421 domain-containing protein [Ruminococcus sp.]|nr:DUF421 domain-containing protein [Ruminococcus sp.]